VSVWQSVSLATKGVTGISTNVFVPQTLESFDHDADGNMTNDGRWVFTWDAENRLVKVETWADAPEASWQRVEWTYDAKGRRIRQTTSVWTNSAWLVIEDLKVISDPMPVGRHIAELNGTNNALVRSYVWGLDFSGTMDGAGGVGGLLWIVVGVAGRSGLEDRFCTHDDNGNVTVLVSANTGTETAGMKTGHSGNLFASQVLPLGRMPSASQPSARTTRGTSSSTNTASTILVSAAG